MRALRTAATLARRTIVHLLQCDDGVGRQTLLRTLVEEKGLGSDGALLRRRRSHLVLLVRGIHGAPSRVGLPSTTPGTYGSVGSAGLAMDDAWRGRDSRKGAKVELPVPDRADSSMRSKGGVERVAHERGSERDRSESVNWQEAEARPARRVNGRAMGGGRRDRGVEAGRGEGVVGGGGQVKVMERVGAALGTLGRLFRPQFVRLCSFAAHLNHSQFPPGKDYCQCHQSAAQRSMPKRRTWRGSPSGSARRTPADAPLPGQKVGPINTFGWPQSPYHICHAISSHHVRHRRTCT